MVESGAEMPLYPLLTDLPGLVPSDVADRLRAAYGVLRLDALYALMARRVIDDPALDFEAVEAAVRDLRPMDRILLNRLERERGPAFRKRKTGRSPKLSGIED